MLRPFTPPCASRSIGQCNPPEQIRTTNAGHKTPKTFILVRGPVAGWFLVLIENKKLSRAWKQHVPAAPLLQPLLPRQSIRLWVVVGAGSVIESSLVDSTSLKLCGVGWDGMSGASWVSNARAARATPTPIEAFYPFCRPDDFLVSVPNGGTRKLTRLQKTDSESVGLGWALVWQRSSVWAEGSELSNECLSQNCYRLLRCPLTYCPDWFQGLSRLAFVVVSS
jgi:hypothetical protein